MKFHTLSLLAGTNACNAKCPFCVSRMTGLDMPSSREDLGVRSDKLRRAIHLASISGVTTAIITGKGEPTLYPDMITDYLTLMGRIDDVSIGLGRGFSSPPIKELQTNGFIFQKGDNGSLNTIDGWRARGLTTILLSNVGPNPMDNRRIYYPHLDDFDYQYISKIVARILDRFLVRLCIVGIKDGVDSQEKLDTAILWAKEIGAHQLTWRPVERTHNYISNDREAYEWSVRNRPTKEQIEEIEGYVESEGTFLYELPSGGKVYDIEGISVCISNCLTRSTDLDRARQLIFYPDGQLFTEWGLTGSRIL